MLRAVELPPKGSGGHTQFADCRQAYDDLSDEMKEFLEDKVACHSLFHNRKVANPDHVLYNDINVLEHPMSRHRIVTTHEGSGRKTLYCNSYTHHIEGLPIEEGRKIVDQILAHISQPKYLYTQYYDNVGDFVIWDNTSVLHRATGGPNVNKYRRDMRRTSTFDMSEHAYGLNEPGKIWRVATL